MKTVWNWIQVALAAIGGGLGWFFGEMDGFFYALIAFVVIDLIQILYLTALHGAALSAALPLAGREIAVSIVFVIPIFFLYNALHKRFRFE